MTQGPRYEELETYTAGPEPRLVRRRLARLWYRLRYSELYWRLRYFLDDWGRR